MKSVSSNSGDSVHNSELNILSPCYLSHVTFTHSVQASGAVIRGVTSRLLCNFPVSGSRVLSGMGPIGPAAGPATSRRFLLGPIRPMPATRSTYFAKGLSFQIMFCRLNMAKIIRSTLLQLVKQLIGRVHRLTSRKTLSIMFVVLSFFHSTLGHS